jgi:hypothetical protein
MKVFAAALVAATLPVSVSAQSAFQLATAGKQGQPSELAVGATVKGELGPGDAKAALRFADFFTLSPASDDEVRIRLVSHTVPVTIHVKSGDMHGKVLLKAQELAPGRETAPIAYRAGDPPLFITLISQKIGGRGAYELAVVGNEQPGVASAAASAGRPAADAAFAGDGAVAELPGPQPHGLLERWGVFARLAGNRWALDANGSMFILSFEWEVPGKVLREEWRPAAGLDNLRHVSRRHEWSDSEGKIVGNEMIGTRYKHEATVASDGSVRVQKTNFISRAAKLSATYRLANGVLTYEESSRGETHGGQLMRLDKERERRFVELANQAWMARIREKNAADDARFDAFQAGLGVVSSALHGAQAEVDARIAAEREQAFALQQMQMEAQRVAMQEQSRQLRESIRTDGSDGAAAAADRTAATSERSAATAANAGATIQIKSAPVTEPVRPIPQKADPGQREVFVVCQVISLYAGELNPDRRRGALFISAPGRVRLVDGRLPDLESAYMARIKSQYRRSGPPVCESADSREQVEAVIRNFKGGYPHYEHVMTGIAPSA